MIFNSISNEYNKVPTNNDHLQRMRMIESQRVTYLSTDKPRLIDSRVFIERNNSNEIYKYPSTNTTLGQINQQLFGQTNMLRYRESIKRRKEFSNISTSSHKGSDLRNSKHSEGSVEHAIGDNDETKYTFNPINDKKSHMAYKPTSGVTRVVNSPYKLRSNIESPSRWTGDRKHIAFTYGQNIYTPNQSQPQKQLFNPNNHYFPSRTSDDFASFIRKPVIGSTLTSNRSTKQLSNQASSVKMYNPPYNEAEEEADRFFDMDFKTGRLVETPVSDNSTRNEKVVKTDNNLSLDSKSKSRDTPKNKLSDMNLIAKISDKYKMLDRDGRIISLVVIGLGVLLVILQTIQ